MTDAQRRGACRAELHLTRESENTFLRTQWLTDPKEEARCLGGRGTIRMCKGPGVGAAWGTQGPEEINAARVEGAQAEVGQQDRPFTATARSFVFTQKVGDAIGGL